MEKERANGGVILIERKGRIRELRRIPIQSATIDCFKHNTSPHRKIPHAGIYNQAPCVVGDLTA
jgi:hypothetical protein